MSLFFHSKSGVIAFVFCVFLAIFSSSCNKKSPETTSTLLAFSTITSMNTDVDTEITQSVTVTNAGAHEAKELNFSIVNLPLFITEDRENPCTNTTLNPGGTCAFVIHFKPTEVKSGNQYLTLSYIDASTSKQNSTVANIFYQGTVASSLLVFSSIRPMTAVLDDVDTQTVTITNTGGSSANHLTLDSVQLPLLPIAEDPDHPCTNKGLAPKEFCSFVISFKPTEHVNSSQSLTVHYVDANSVKKKSATVPVFYRDVPAAGDANLVFLNIEPMITFVGAAKEQTVTIINSGKSSASGLNVQKLQSPLYIVKDDCSSLQTLAVNSTCKLVVKLVDTDRTFGILNQAIKINYNNSKQNTFATANIPYQIIASDLENRLTFQSINKLMTTGINSRVSQIVTVLNRGQDVTGVQLVPLASTSFIKIDDDNCSGQTIKSQVTCTFVVSFNPKTAVKLSRDLLALTYQKTGDSAQIPYALSQYVSYQTNDKDSSDPSDAYVPNGDLGIYNDCQEPVWIEFTPVGDPATLPVPASDNLKLIQPGKSVDFGIPTKGIPSLKFWAKKGCDENGIHCAVGQSADTHFSRTPPDPENPPSDCDPKYGCQPSVDTLFESTFGCTEADRSKCEKDAKNHPLTNATFFDISLVDGYTIPMSTRVITNENENNQECQGTPTPDLDFTGFSDCPQAENLTALTDNWSINSNPERWDWDTISGNSNNQVIDPFWGSDLQKAIKGIDKTVWQSGVKDLQNNISQIPTTNPFKCYDSINHLKQTTIDLNSVDLRIKNPNSSTVVACGSPKEILNGNRRWGALGIGNQCTEQIIPEHKDPKDPSKTIPDSPMSSVDQTYLDYNLVYSNPYTDSIMLNPTNPNKDTNPTWNNRWPSLSHFCKNTGNSPFCLDPVQPGAPRSGLAAIMGHAGPIFNSQYVQNIKKKSDQVYAWQYDDSAGTRVCNKRPKVVVTLCKKVE